MTTWLVHRLDHPEWVGALAGLCLAAGLAVLLARYVAARRRRRLGARRLRPRGHRPSDLLLLGALLAIALALAGPRIGTRTVRVPAGGVDVVVLVDVSNSMDARDVAPSRLARAREGAAALLARLEPQDRAALAVFAGRGVLMTPLTPDRDALAELVSALDTELIHPASSDLGAGLRASLDAFVAGSERPRAIFVLADGEDTRSSRTEALGPLLRAQVRVSGVAIGTDAGGTIPDHGAELRDRRGALVVTRRRAARLEEVVEATGGTAFRGDAFGRFDLDAAVAAVRREAGAPGSATTLRRESVVQVAPLAALAFALLLLESLPRRSFTLRGRILRGHGWRGRIRPTTLATPVFCLVLLGAGPAGAPPDARTLLRLGIARLEAGDARGAERAFTAAALTARDPALAALAYHDLGVVALERGDLPAARDAFFDAVAMHPGDGRARFNLEWTLRALAVAPPPPEPATAPQPRRPEPPPPDPEAEAPPEPDARAEPEAPSPEPETRPDRSEVREPPEAQEPASEAERRRWLERMEDDPGRSLRLTAREGGRRRPAGPVW